MVESKTETHETHEILTTKTTIKKEALLEYLAKLPDGADVTIYAKYSDDFYENVVGFTFHSVVEHQTEDEKALHLQMVATNMYSC